MSKVYYCYSPYLKKYLMNKGFRYVTTGRNKNSHDFFWLYLKDDELDVALREYSSK